MEKTYIYDFEVNIKIDPIVMEKVLFFFRLLFVCFSV